MSPSFNKRYCWCLGKHSQAETGFETNFLPVTGKNSSKFLSAVSTCKSAKPRWSCKSSRCAESNFKDEDNKCETYDGWQPYSDESEEEEEESELVGKSGNNTAMLA